MSEQYTPTTDEVRDAWAKRNALYRSTSLASLGYRAHVATNSDRYSAEDYADFDRWLASHEAAIRRDQIERIAARLEEPGVLWWGDGGVRVQVDEHRMQAIPLTQWLRAQVGDTDEQ